ncbi:hypothetical protein ABIA24_001791 [Sinorhizobium fredii]
MYWAMGLAAYAIDAFLDRVNQEVFRHRERRSRREAVIRTERLMSMDASEV